MLNYTLHSARIRAAGRFRSVSKVTWRPKFDARKEQAFSLPLPQNRLWGPPS